MVTAMVTMAVIWLWWRNSQGESAQKRRFLLSGKGTALVTSLLANYRPSLLQRLGRPNSRGTLASHHPSFVIRLAVESVQKESHAGGSPKKLQRSKGVVCADPRSERSQSKNKHRAEEGTSLPLLWRGWHLPVLQALPSVLLPVSPAERNALYFWIRSIFGKMWIGFFSVVWSFMFSKTLIINAELLLLLLL